MSANAVGFTLLILRVALLLGKFVRVKVGWVQSLFRSDEYYSAGTMTSCPSSVEPFSLHMSIAAVAGGVRDRGAHGSVLRPST